MKKIAIVVLAAATVLFTGASAGAAEMFTPPCSWAAANSCTVTSSM